MHQRISNFQSGTPFAIPHPVKASFVPLMKNDEFSRVATLQKIWRHVDCSSNILLSVPDSKLWFRILRRARR
jgi:hypothetical protein